ncbi:MAG: DNA helicase RecQ [Bacteroidetes bacterium]|nr:DNA helicase RecQ [Bacteroidota bacterium]
MVEEVEIQSMHETLQSFFGFDGFKGNQEAIIGSILNGNDTFVIMPTGGGKSLCYQLPAIMSEGTAIVVSPLIALMKNQVDAIRGFSNERGIAHFLNSSLNKSDIAKVKADVLAGRTKLLYVAPETLNKEDNIEFFSEFKISFFAIDEAHCISEWGHDFRPEYRRLRPIIDKLGSVPVMALTATATPKVQQDIQKNLGMMNARLYKSSFNRPNLYYDVRPKQNVIKEIIKYIKQNTGKSGIIYCLSRKKVEEISEALKVNGIKAAAYHAGLDAKERAKTQDMFLMEELDVIVATIAFGMGIDKPDVRYVIHHDIPKSLEGYYQETGRAGRDGGEGNCLTFYSYDDIIKLEKFMKDKPVAEQEIGKQMLSETAAFAETSSCRRKFILHYFGEEFEESNCNGMCDNCRHPKQRFEAKDDLELVIEAVLEVKEKHKIKDIVHLLMGTLTATGKSYKHNTLEVWSKGVEDDKDEKFWNAVLRQAVVNGYLQKDVENYGILKVTDKGKAFLKKPHSIKFTRDHDFSNTDADEDDIIASGKGSGGADQVLFGILKDLTKKIAKQNNLPPYVIFQETSLEEMSIQYPITMDELTKITGVGAGKAAKYGKPFIDLIKKHVEDNEIERPVDMVIKSVVNKSGLKVFIIQSIDRKVNLEDMAKTKNMKVNELLTEIETIVASGTKVNINYYINDVIDEEKQEEVYEYLREAETDDIQAALKELGEDDYSEEEIRLMRIKFISEFGN